MKKWKNVIYNILIVLLMLTNTFTTSFVAVAQSLETQSTTQAVEAPVASTSQESEGSTAENAESLEQEEQSESGSNEASTSETEAGYSSFRKRVSSSNVRVQLVSDGTPVPSGGKIDYYADIEVNYRVDIPNSTSISAGDTMQLTIPPQLKISTTTTFDINSAGGKAGTATADPNTGKITVTFNDYFVSRPENKYIALNLYVKWNHDNTQSNVPIDLNFDGYHVQVRKGEENGIPSNETLQKYGLADPNDDKIINWTVRINVAKHKVNNARITDTFSANQEYVDGSLEAYYVRNMNTYDFIGPVEANKFNFRKNGFTANFGYLDKPIYFTYKTRITDNGARGRYTNNINYSGSQGTINERLASFRYQGGSGNAGGGRADNVVLQANKKLVGRDVANGEFNFSLYKVNGGAEELVEQVTNDAAGLVKFSGLRFDQEGTFNYVIRENAGQDATITYDTEPIQVKIVVTDEDGIKYADVTYTKNGETSAAGAQESAVNNFTNTYRLSISGKKVWDDRQNAENTRPSSITVVLERRDPDSGVTEEVEEKVVNAVAGQDEWSFAFENLTARNAANHDYQYSIKERDVVGYDASYDQSTYTITNRRSTTSYTATKVWQGGPAQKPTITFVLQQNGVDYTGADARKELTNGQTSVTWTDLPLKDAQGANYTYSVREEAVAGYETSYSGSTVTNTNNETVELQGKKVWDDYNNKFNKRPSKIKIIVKQNGVAQDQYSKEVTGGVENEWQFSITGLPKYDASGNEYTYTLEEEPVAEYDAPTTQEQNGVTVVTNRYENTEKISISGKKVWDDYNNKFNTRPSKITIKVKQNGVELSQYTKEVTGNAADNEWSFTVDNLPKYDAQGNEYVYTIEEEQVTNYLPPTYSMEGTTTVINNKYVNNETVDLSGKKIWQDYSNKFNKRPAAIRVKVKQNGTELPQYTKEVTGGADNEWQFTITGLPKYDEHGELYNYTLEEEAVAEYDAPVYGTDNGVYTIQNTYVERTKISISGKKIWADNSNQDGIRPDSVTVDLYANNTKLKSVEVPKVAGSDEWTYTFDNLDKYDADGNEISYTVDEATVPQGYQKAITNYDITNSYTPEVTTFKVTKAWQDDSDRDGKRPNVIKAQLYADGAKYGDAVDLTEGNAWTYTWTNLPKKSNGTVIVYTVDEEVVPAEYTKAVTPNGESEATITNTHAIEKTAITGTKTWQDDSDRDGKRPQSVVVKLLANNTEVQRQTVTAANGWTYAFNDLPKYENKQLINYTIEEEVPAGYAATYSGTGTTRDVTNTYTPGRTSISVRKVWNDTENQDGKRPQGIQVQLYKNDQPEGTPVELNDANGWAYTWNNLFEKEAGQTITYRVDEVGGLPQGYTKEVTNVGTNFTITNTRPVEKTVVRGQKTWVDNENQDGVRPKEIRVSLLADNVVKETKTVTANENWAYEFTDLDVYKNGQLIQYTVSEEAVADYMTTYAGFNVTNTHAVDKTSISVVKSWNDKNDQDGKRPQSVEVQLYANDVAQGAPVALNAGNSWRYTWTDLDVKANGQKIVYRVDEVNVPAGYTKQVTADAQAQNYTIENTHEVELVNVSGIKHWEDKDDQDRVRPAQIRVHLLADGVEIQQQDVTAVNNWAYSFENLPKFKSGAVGTPIVYTVREEVPGDYTPTYSTVLGNYDITNTRTPDKTSFTVTKAFNDNSNQDGIRPTSVQVQLLKAGQPEGDVVTLDASNNWTYTWTNLEKKANGVEIEYSVQEVNVPAGYTATVVKADALNATITNTHTPEVVSISGRKNWVDNENQDGVRPTTIRVSVVDGDNTVVQTKDVTAADNWQYEFVGLPKKKAGVDIQYTIREEAVDGYVTTYAGRDVVNTHAVDKTSITVNKVWADEQNQDGKRLGSVQAQLYANGQAQGTPVELNEANNWTYTWTNLDAKANGAKIAYTVQEVTQVPDYTATVTPVDETHVTITNAHTPEVVEVSGQKTWVDNEDQDGVRPTTIRVTLLENNVPRETKDVTANDNWRYTWTNLPKYKNGQLVQYSVSEEAVPGYTTTYNGMNITNTHTPGETSITVNKAWQDNEDQDGKRPASIQVQLKKNGANEGAAVELNAANNWSYTWTNLPEKANGQVITYTVEEVGTVANYTATTVKNGNTVTITNAHTPELIDVAGTKTWTDNDNQDGVRPNAIRVNLLADGVVQETKEVTAANGWQYRFANLPKYKAKGVVINYTVTEEVVADYTVQVAGHDIQNTHAVNKTSVSVTKAWNDVNDQDGIRPNSVKVQLYGNDKKVGAEVELNKANNWTYTWSNLDEKSAGQVVVYTVKEVGTVTGYVTAVTMTSPRNFTITNTHTPEVLAVEGQKTWQDHDNQDGVRPEKIKVNLLADGVVIDTKEISVAEAWKYRFDNLPKFKEQGVLIQYTVTEEAVADYTVAYKGYDITNTHAPGKTSISVVKAWNDKENQDGVRPEKVQVQLYANDTASGQPIELTKENDWKYTWSNLDEKVNGQVIRYTVKEVNVPAGYTEVVTTTSPGNFTITNTHTPELTEVSGEKEWVDENDKAKVRPQAIKVNLIVEGKVVDSREVSEATGWKYSFTGLAKYNEGKLVTYSVLEEPVAGYTATYDGYNIKNTIVPEDKTAITVLKSWDDKQNRDNIRPKSVKAQLYANDKAVGEAVELNAENDWKHTWQELAVKDGDKEIQYTVKEVNVPAGYTATVASPNKESVIITNTHTPKEKRELPKTGENNGLVFALVAGMLALNAVVFVVGYRKQQMQ